MACRNMIKGHPRNIFYNIIWEIGLILSEKKIFEVFTYDIYNIKQNSPALDGHVFSTNNHGLKEYDRRSRKERVYTIIWESA